MDRIRTKVVKRFYSRSSLGLEANPLSQIAYRHDLVQVTVSVIFTSFKNL